MRKLWIENKKMLALKTEMQAVQPKGLRLTENSYKLKENSIDLWELSQKFTETLNVIFIEKATETTLLINWYNNLLKIILALALTVVGLLLGFFMIAYTIILLWTIIQNIINYWRNKKKKKYFPSIYAKYFN